MRARALSRFVSCAVIVSSKSIHASSNHHHHQKVIAASFLGLSRAHLQQQYDRTSLLTSKRNMSSSDEVQKAQEAAAAYKSSDTDGAGPATVFDKILSGEWSSDKVHEDDKCLAFRDINPQAPVHILVIPKNRDGLTQLSKAREDQKELLGHLMYVAQSIGQKECPEGFRVVINDGANGAQSVYHLHLHVMGGRQMEWPPG